MTDNISTKSKNKKCVLYMVVVIGVATYAAASKDILLTIASALVSGGFFAAVCLCNFNLLTIVPMFIIPPVGVYFATGDLILSFMSLSFLPVGVAVYYSIKKNLSRSQTIVRSMISMLVFYAIVYSAYIVKIFGALTFDNIKLYIDLNFELLRQYMNYVKQIYIENGMDAETYFSYELIEEAILSLKLSLLGYVLALFGICSFASTAIAKKASAAFGAFPEKMGEWKFVLSKIGAWVFIFAYIAGGLYSADTEGLYLPFAINSICVCMFPAVLYMAGAKLKSKLRAGAGVSFIIMASILLALFGSFVVLILMIVGLYSTLTYQNNTSSEIEQK